MATINDNERKVLEVLNSLTRRDGEACITFKLLGDKAKMDIKAVRRSCRSLRRKGFAEFHSGLMDEEGMAAGSGYCVSEEGEIFFDGLLKK